MSVSDRDAITDDQVWTDGDCVVVTSDKVRFRVQSYHLCSASHVFGTMLKLPQGSACPSTDITLDDSDFETSAVFRAFLDLVVNGTVVIPNTFNANVTSFAKFLDKWDCQAAKNNYISHVKNALHDRTLYGVVGFLIGAALDDSGVCRVALSRADQFWTGKQGDPRLINKGTREKNAFDPAHWPYFMWTGVRTDYMAALARAFGEVGPGDKLSTVFLEYLKLAKAEK